MAVHAGADGVAVEGDVRAGVGDPPPAGAAVPVSVGSAVTVSSDVAVGEAASVEVGAGSGSSRGVGVAGPGVEERVGTVCRRGSWPGLAHAVRAREPRRIAPQIKSAASALDTRKDR